VIGKVEKYLIDKIHEEGAIHITLIDLCSPKEITNQLASQIALEAESYGTAAIMVGGSSFVYTPLLDDVIKAVKKTVKIPVIIFPNNVTGISRHADAIWFMSLLNSSDPYFITGAQVLGAPIIKEFGLETIPLGYIVIGTGGSVGVIGRVSTIPYNKPEIAVAHALAAQYFGMRFVYLEAGSGAEQRVPNDMIKKVKKIIDVPLIVGGGIRTGKQAKEIVSAGANVVVTSTTMENFKSKNRVKELIDNIKIKEDKT
jgi:phosphoglycerol geranylgeranyltransferase